MDDQARQERKRGKTKEKDPWFFAVSSSRMSDFEEADMLETQPVVTDAVLRHRVLAEIDL